MKQRLVEALTSGHLGGAAIDVYEHEPYQGPLSDIPNVFLTAHQGSCSHTGRYQMETGSAGNAIDFWCGRPMDPQRTVYMPDDYTPPGA